uniref:Uncharacterized protein n=1 Tax=Meloidogyne enterolobii TaxID=390850 RepID=A0A6V7TRU7_MELEN|nr:unnamed protein product [Meloidogyne enterolobii]
MAEDEISNFDMELIPSQSDYLKLQNNFANLQTKFLDEKENSFNLEKKNRLLENKLKEKELNLKIKEIEDKNVFLENKLKEMNEKIQKIKSENKQKDEKINLLEKANYLINEKVIDLAIGLEQLKNIVFIPLSFVKIENKWKEIDFSYRSDFKCCENKCINTYNPIGNCCKGNGFVNLIYDGNIKYIKHGEGKGVNKSSLIIAENYFKEPQNYINWSSFYFEIKCTKIEGLLNNEKI